MENSIPVENLTRKFKDVLIDKKKYCVSSNVEEVGETKCIPLSKKSMTKKTPRDKHCADIEKTFSEPRERQAVKKWKIEKPVDNEITILEHISKKTSILTSSLEKEIETVSKEIQRKLYGYKYQDKQKELFLETEFLSFENIVDLLIASQLTCVYCKKAVQVLYHNVREPRQWSVDRIDNSIGHNNNNVQIACLDCNLKRKTILHKKYLMTKELIIEKIE